MLFRLSIYIRRDFRWLSLDFLSALTMNWSTRSPRELHICAGKLQSFTPQTHVFDVTGKHVLSACVHGKMQSTVVFVECRLPYVLCRAKTYSLWMASESWIEPYPCLPSQTQDALGSNCFLKGQISRFPCVASRPWWSFQNYQPNAWSRSDKLQS